MRRARAAAMGWTVWIATAMLAVGACGGGSSSTGTGGHGGTGATGGSGGTAASGQGGGSGSLGGGGAGNGGGNLPACAIVQRPTDPMNSSATTIDSRNGTCNTLQLDGQPVAGEPLDAVDAGAREDGGTIETAAGGTILDGDYDFVRWEDVPGRSAVRKLRVFGGGTYIEWADSNVPGGAPDGGPVDIWFDTTAASSGPTLSFSYVCGTPSVTSYGYTARGDDLIFFDYLNSPGSILAVDTYRRTCTRP